MFQVTAPRNEGLFELEADGASEQHQMIPNTNPPQFSVLHPPESGGTKSMEEEEEEEEE